jgi:azurin
MEVTTRIYLMKDSQGNKASVTVEEDCNMAQICGMKNKENESIYFESDAYHIHSFCKHNDIELKVIGRKYDFDTLWNEN